MGFRSCWSAVFILFFLPGCTTVLVGAEEKLPFNVDEWLTRPDHKEIPWKVWTSKPSLTLQQRYLVSVRADINCGKLKERKRGRVLHFVLKVADVESHWNDNFDYTRVPIPTEVTRSAQVWYTSGVYLRPGRYTLALMVYDDFSGKGNLWRTSVNVSAPENDPLPNLDRDLQSIEFLEWDYGWPLGKGKEWLPVKNRRRVCMDIVVITGYVMPMRVLASAAASRSDMSGMPIQFTDFNMELLRTSSVLSHLGFSNGSVRISIIDPPKKKTIFYREDASKFDWQKAIRQIMQQNPYKVDAESLASQKGMGEDLQGLRDKLLEIVGDPDCGGETEQTLREIVIVCTPVLNSKNTKIQTLVLPTRSSASILIVTWGSERERFSGNYFLKFVKDAKMKTISIADGIEFRRELASFIERLESLE